MIKRLRVLDGEGFDPHRNLAIEQLLAESAREGELTLYLWQNRRTVVIGRNQNAYAECRLAELNRDGGTLARRLSGGGAVYHDLGNLNFTFAARSDDYDQKRQQSVILQACRRLGAPAELSGRNDILADGRKFSGCSYWSHAGRSFHNGTLLVDADLGDLGRYLSPSKLKLESKGVASVRSRVCNLREFVPNLSINTLKNAIIEAFCDEYRLPIETIGECDLDKKEIEKKREIFASDEWLFGRKLPFSCEIAGRFEWGEVTLRLAVERGAVAGAEVFTDALDAAFAPALAGALHGSRFAAEALCERIRACGACSGVADELCELVAAQVG